MIFFFSHQIVYLENFTQSYRTFWVKLYHKHSYSLSTLYCVFFFPQINSSRYTIVVATETKILVKDAKYFLLNPIFFYGNHFPTANQTMTSLRNANSCGSQFIWCFQPFAGDGLKLKMRKIIAIFNVNLLSTFLLYNLNDVWSSIPLVGIFLLITTRTRASCDTISFID